MTPQRQGSLSKTARLMFLQRQQEAGTLGTNKNQLARLLGVSRFTLYRDLADLKKLLPIYEELSRNMSESKSPT